MTIQTTAWHPDTCRCVVEYEWDDQEPLETRSHNFKRQVATCPDHVGLPGAATYGQIVKENQAKNRFLDDAIKGVPGKLRRANPNNDVVELNESVSFEWSFTGVGLARALKVKFNGVQFTAPERTQLNALTTKYVIPVTVE